jgi:hypothetical protein
MAKVTKKAPGPLVKVTPTKSVKIDGVLYVGGQEQEVTLSVLKKMQDTGFAAVSEPGPSTVRSLLSDEAQVGRPRESVEGADDDEPYASTEVEDEDEENVDNDPDAEEEEVEEDVEEEDPVTQQKRTVKRKTKRAKRSSRR